MTTEAHPLFLPEDDDEPISVSEIQICRVEQGQQVYYPRIFPATEMMSLEQVHAELGGGQYIIIARHEGKISSKRKYVIPGKPKPMYDEGRQEKETAPATATVPIPTGTDPMMSMIMMMMQGMMQQQAQAQQSQTQMFIAMMQGNQQSTSEEKAAARAELQANIERERISSERTMSLMREMMVAKGSGGGSEDFTRGVEFMRSFATQQVEVLRSQVKGDETDWGSILETFGQAMQGFGMLKNLTGGGPLPEGAGVPGAVAEVAQ